MEDHDALRSPPGSGRRSGGGSAASVQPAGPSRNGVIMSVLTGPGRNSEMSMMRSSKRLGAELADQLALARATRSGSSPRVLGRADQLVRSRSSSSGTCASSSRSICDPVDPLDLGDGVRHRRLHPDAEHVELEQAEVLDVVLVELAHREAQPAGLDRGAVEQRGVGQQTPHGCRAMCRGRPSSRSTRSNSRSSRGLVEAAGCAARAARAMALPGVAGADVRERLGDRVDLAAAACPSAAPTSRTACRTR